MISVHKTVLLNETIEGLNLSKNALVIDCTFGGGGHPMASGFTIKSPSAGLKEIFIY